MKMSAGFLSTAFLMAFGLSGCMDATTTAVSPTPATPIPAAVSSQYPNLFRDLLGKSDAEIQAKIDAAWNHFFYGDPNTQAVYYPVAEDRAYIKDIGNNDVRSEGISYGMMIAVQLNKQEEFDRLWTWAKTYMYQADGQYAGYFSWHNREDGTPLDSNPASDGEEWIVMALFFAAHRWGNGQGIYNYSAEANQILHTMRHKREDNTLATNMFDAETNMVVFVPTRGRVSQFTDPSYHLPHYYQLWAQWAVADNEQWEMAAAISRQFLKDSAHPQTGLFPDYAEFDGTPVDYGGGHADFRFDAWRTAMNIAVDYVWFAQDSWAVAQSNRWLNFFYDQGIGRYGNQYTLDGQMLSADHSPGLVAMNATAALAADNPQRAEFVQALWELEAPSGQWRYYDGLLYLLALLQVSGNFQIYHPAGVGG